MEPAPEATKRPRPGGRLITPCPSTHSWWIPEAAGHPAEPSGRALDSAKTGLTLAAQTPELDSYGKERHDSNQGGITFVSVLFDNKQNYCVALSSVGLAMKTRTALNSETLQPLPRLKAYGTGPSPFFFFFFFQMAALDPLYLMYMNVVCIDVCVPRVCLVPLEVGSGHQTSWSHRWLHSRWTWRIEPGLCTRATALNC